MPVKTTFSTLPALSTRRTQRAWALDDWSKALGLVPSAGLMVVTLDGASLKTKAALFKALAKGLSFPSYFGSNWDALDECLQDLGWLDAKQVLLVFQDAHLALPKAQEAAILWGLLSELRSKKLKALRVLKA